MIHDIFMPALSSTMTEGKIVSWEKKPGDKVEKGETVVVVESDKADMDVESFYSGYLATILVDAGQEAPVGQAIAYIAETEAEIEEANKKASSGAATSTTTETTKEKVEKVEPAPQPVASVAVATTTATSTAQTNGRIIASPRAKKLAKELKVDLATIQGSGIRGRIVAEDVEQAAGKTPTAPAVTQVASITSAPVAIPSVIPAATPVSKLAGKTVPFNTLQQAVVRNMTASLQVPTFQVSYNITTDALDALYRKIKPKGVTMTALLAKAVAVTLQKHPLVNASFTDEGIKYNESINISVAVAMPDGGLITPVIQKADEADIYSLARSWQGLVARARAKQLQPEEYSTGTFTLSNLGMFGVDQFTAILPPGQGSILAIGGATPTVVADGNGLFGVKNQMKVTITCDHRIIYGTDAAAFLKDLAELIENDPHSLTL